MPLLKYLVAAGVIVAAGAFGYRYYQQYQVELPNTPATVATSTGTPVPSSPTVITPPAIDATWQTYQNGTLKFLLNYPTKGLYAPKFSVKIINENDAAVKDGCYDAFTNGVIERTALNGIEFCRVTHLANPPTIAVDTEFWTTQKDTRLAVITFTKKYSTSTASNSFDINAYRNFVAGLMSTFRYPGMPTSTSPTP